MQMWNFENKDFLILFISVICIFVVIVLITISLIISARNDYGFFKKVQHEVNTTRIFAINLNDNTVLFFDKNDISHKKKKDINYFYNNIHHLDQERVKGWISDHAAQNNDAAEFIQCDVILHGKAQYFSLLKFVKYDSDRNIIHIESYILEYITPINSIKRKSNSRIVTADQVRNVFSEKKASTGYTFCLRFFFLSNHINQEIEENEIMVLIPENVLYPFVNQKRHARYLIENSKSELILFDYGINSDEKALVLSSSIEHAIQQEIDINGLEDYVGFAIGIVNNVQYYHDFDTLLSTSQQACIYAQQNNLKQYLFTRSASSPVVESGKYEQEITRLLEPLSLKYLFRPIINSTLGTVIGYMAHLKAFDTPFKGYVEMNKYASKVGKNKTLFSLMSKNFINIFSSEKNSEESILFLPVSFNDIQYIIEVFDQFSIKNRCKILLLFEMSDSIDAVIDYNDINSCFNKLKSAGYLLGLSIKDNKVILPESIYMNFDYFVVGASMISDSKNNDYLRLSFRTLIEQLLKYKKPIIANDIDNNPSLEVIIKSGIELVSSDIIAKPSTMIIPVDKRKLDKLVAISDQY